jgi:hypothetical protein
MGRANWKSPAGQDELFVSVLVAEKQAGRQSESGWKRSSYQVVVDALKKKLGVEYTTDQCQNHWSNVSSCIYHLFNI